MSAWKVKFAVQRRASRRSSVVLKTKTDNLDEVLHAIGECSHYQIRRHLLFFLLTIPFACQSLLIVFAGNFPAMCMETGPKKCEKIDILDRQKVCKYSRQTQFRFREPEEFSIVTEFHLICDKSYLKQVANSVFFIGAFFGTIIIGWISESFGRKPVMFCCLVIVSFIASLSAIADSFWYFIMARCFTGFFLSGIAVSLYVIASEVIGFSYRTMLDIFIWNYFSLGLMLLTMKAYLLENWRNLQLVTTLPYLLIFACFRFIPESLRWLWRTGHYNRANRTVSTIAAENNKSDALTMFPDVLSIEADDEELSCCHVLRHKRRLLYFSILALIMFVVGFIYYGLFLVSEYLSGIIYKDFALMAFMEIPANFLAILSLRRIGRKKTVGIGLLFTCVLCGVLCVLITYRAAVSNWRSATLATALFCKMFLTSSLLTLILWAKELHHLMGRTQSIGIIHSFRPLGGAVAPWLTASIIQSSPVTPFLVMCALSALAGSLAFLLPETHDIKSNHYDDDDDDDDNDDDDDEDRDDNKEEDGGVGDSTVFRSSSSFDNSKTVFTGVNGTVDQNLNKTTETTISAVRKSNIVKLVDVNFDYVGLSQLDRETNI